MICFCRKGNSPMKRPKPESISVTLNTLIIVPCLCLSLKPFFFFKKQVIKSWNLKEIKKVDSRGTHLYVRGSVFLAGVWGWTSSRSRCTHKASLLCGCVYGPSACRRLWNSSRRIRTQTGDRLKTRVVSQQQAEAATADTNTKHSPLSWDRIKG